MQADGIVGQATWYELVRLYSAVTNLSELLSQGQTYYNIAWAGPMPIQQGDRGIRVEQLQYMLRVLSAYINEIPNIAIDGIFGPATRSAVLAAQRRFGLPQTGSVDFDTWEAIFNQFTGIEDTSLRGFERLPYTQPSSTRIRPGRGIPARQILLNSRGTPSPRETGTMPGGRETDESGPNLLQPAGTQPAMDAAYHCPA